MNRYKRATGVVLASAVISTGLSVGMSGTAQAAVPARSISSQAVHGTQTQQLPILGGVLSLVTGPLLSGTGAVGSLISLTDPVYNLLTGVTNKYQWMRDGDPIAGATGKTYTPTAGDAGHQITALVTGTVLGLVPITSLTSALPIPLPGGGSGGGGVDPLNLVASVLPVLSGAPVVGGLLNISDVTWSLGGVLTSTQWLRNGIPIPGATGSSYLPTLQDAGQQITALVTGSLLGLLPVSVLTNALTIPLSGGGGLDPSSLFASILPLLQGVPVVGGALSLLPGEWSLPGVTTSIQWLANGVPILGATGSSLPLTGDLLGADVSAVVTGALAGLPLVSVITSALGVSSLADAITAALPPALTGAGLVGTVLNGSAPEWSVQGVTTSYQWLRNGAPIPGATQQSYTLTADDAAKQITMKATGTKGSATGTATSAPVLGKLAEALSNVSKPVVGGSAKVGGLLNVAPGVWNGLTQPVFGYQWFANGTAIPGATGSQYVVKAADAGRSLAVLVTATRAGTPSVSAPTDVVDIAKLTSRTLAKAVKKQVRAGTSALLKLTISSAGSASSGKVAVVDGKKLLKTYTVRTSDNGSRIVKLPKLKKGKHSLLAVFLGSATQAPSVSRVAVLKVTKAAKK